jgi:2-dehydropantoate 2-reductase
MRTLIIGSGAIGCYLASQLHAAGKDVTLHGLGAVFERIVTDGGIVLQPQGAPEAAHLVPLNCTREPASDGWDVVIFAVKAHDLGRAAQQFMRQARGAVSVLPQNGLPWWQFLGTDAAPVRLESVDPGGLAESALPLGQIAGGVITKGLTLTPDARLVEARVASDSVAVGDVVRGSGAATRVFELFRDAGLPASCSEDIRTDKWRKLLVNVAFNPLGAISQLGFGEVLDDLAGEELARTLMREALMVARASGLEASLDVDAALNRARSSRLHRTSMLQDVQAGRPLELESIVGVMLELARNQALAVPAIASIYACLRLLNLSLRKGPIRQEHHPVHTA